MRVAEIEAAASAAIRAGDESAFVALAERYRRQLHVHCYRMLGSFHDAEDMVQETLLRAWRARDTFQGRSLFRTWLFSIATNVCLSALARSKSRILVADVRRGIPSRSCPPRSDRTWAHLPPTCPGSSRTRTGCSMRQHRAKRSPRR